jgi:hypothetical protein
MNVIVRNGYVHVELINAIGQINVSNEHISVMENLIVTMAKMN